MARRRVLLVGGGAPEMQIISEHFGHSDSHEVAVESIDYCDDALMLLRRRQFDLVLILSLNAPWRSWPSLSTPGRHVGGRSAILFLKQLRAFHNPPRVILASGFPLAEDEARANGAFALVHKPLILAELDRVVARALEAEPGWQ